MTVATNKNGMWGVIVWSGEIDNQAALITSSRLGTNLWIYKVQKAHWFQPKEKSFWHKEKSFKDRASAFEALKITK